MAAREGQTRVEVRPGAFVWMDEADHNAWLAANGVAERDPVDNSDKVREFNTSGRETATVSAPERAVQPPARPRAKPKAKA